ncbi:MAG: M1 family metallopeptidase [Chitinophagaceae bacterium]|nr:M1 family metallopeptidase [Chitinophagaceae bacterium]
MSIRTLLLIAAIICCTRVLGQSYNPCVDVQHYDFSLKVNDTSDRIIGEALVTVRFKNPSNSFHLDLSGAMHVSSVKENNKPVKFTQTKDLLVIYTHKTSDEKATYAIRYSGIPADGLIISKNKFGHRGFFGDNWPNRAHKWLPCVDHPSDKATVDWHITAPDHYTVVANGALQEERSLPRRLKITHWKESAPLSPKIMVIGIADFAVDHPGDVEGIPVYNYVYPENKEQGFRSYAHALRILPFYIHHIGPYPFEKCGNVQSKTRFGGLENASAIFYYENSVSSPGIESLMAHEIAHQWFGDAVTETEWRYLWLSEGFATYMTHCYLEDTYGTDTLKAGMKKDRDQVVSFEKNRLVPVIDSSIKKDYMQLLNPNSYQKGGWVLHMLRRKIGDSLFWKGISTYYTTYRDKNASTEDLQTIMTTVSGQDLRPFFHQWLYMPGHPSIKLEWHYDTASSALFITSTQLQPIPYAFSLELSIDGALHTMEITAKTNQVRIPLVAEPTTIIPDPDVNLLADFSY